MRVWSHYDSGVEINFKAPKCAWGVPPARRGASLTYHNEHAGSGTNRGCVSSTSGGVPHFREKRGFVIPEVEHSGLAESTPAMLLLTSKTHRQCR